MNDPQTERPATLPWPPILLVAGVALAVLLGRYYPLEWPGLDDLAARVIGYGVGAAGLALIIWGIVTLRRANTTVLPTGRADRLVTEGAFAFRRNPIYMGDVLLLLSLAEVTHNIWFAVLTPVLAVALYVLAIRPEEEHLEARFGQAYVDYKERTRAWF